MNCYLFQIFFAPLQLDTSCKEQSRPGHEVGGGTEFGNRFDGLESLPDCQNFVSDLQDIHEEALLCETLFKLTSFQRSWFGLELVIVDVEVLQVEDGVDCDLSNAFNDGDI